MPAPAHLTVDTMAEETPSVSKKDQIISLYLAGFRNVDEIAQLTQARSSYIAQVLRDAQLLGGYFDLYTSSERPMNVYSKFFTKKLGFKDENAARQSIAYIDLLYHQFERIEDRAGQHHALYMTLTMRNRALWSDKTAEAKIFNDWLINELSIPPKRPLTTATHSMERQLDKRTVQSKEKRK